MYTFGGQFHPCCRSGGRVKGCAGYQPKKNQLMSRQILFFVHAKKISHVRNSVAGVVSAVGSMGWGFQFWILPDYEPPPRASSCNTPSKESRNQVTVITSCPFLRLSIATLALRCMPPPLCLHPSALHRSSSCRTRAPSPPSSKVQGARVKGHGSRVLGHGSRVLGHGSRVTGH